MGQKQQVVCCIASRLRRNELTRTRTSDRAGSNHSCLSPCSERNCAVLLQLRRTGHAQSKPMDASTGRVPQSRQKYESSYKHRSVHSFSLSLFGQVSTTSKLNYYCSFSCQRARALAPSHLAPRRSSRHFPPSVSSNLVLPPRLSKVHPSPAHCPSHHIQWANTGGGVEAVSTSSLRQIGTCFGIRTKTKIPESRTGTIPIPPVL
jgi:hypothetical protein